MFELSSAPGKGFWARHRWKMLLSLGVADAGYAAYRFYDAHQKQLVRVERKGSGAPVHPIRSPIKYMGRELDSCGFLPRNPKVIVGCVREVC